MRSCECRAGALGPAFHEQINRLVQFPVRELKELQRAAGVGTRDAHERSQRVL